tara:strand:+ start:346 stop:582 length:237 start_codon:yes stop_codon:yes gene_type:complete
MDDKFCIDMKYLRPLISNAINKEKICLTIVAEIAKDIGSDSYWEEGAYGTLKPDDHPSMVLRRHLAKQLENLVMGDKE